MSEIYIDCQPVGTDDEKLVFKKKKVSFEGGMDTNNQEFQIAAVSIVSFGVLCTALYLGRKFFFKRQD
tara:strand:+ start:99 stop:302 length:204 start_codon:yes stop_codon:yes gene_type:complete